MLNLNIFASTEKARGYLEVGDNIWPCALGAAGLSHNKSEGDGATPIGSYSLRRLWYRADRFTPPAGAIPQRAIERDDGWSDDPNDAAYNKPVRLPHKFSHEELWRPGQLYDAFFEIGYNDQPVVAGAGSAIFLHLEKNDYQPTRGCIAISRDHMMQLIPLLGPRSRVTISDTVKSL